MRLPEAFRRPRPDTYARACCIAIRRALHRHRDDLGAGAGDTPVHDHGGLWCVEGVVEGQIAVTRYDVAGEPDERYRVAADRHADRRHGRPAA